MEYYFQRYGDLELHRRMIGDRARTEAFARAIAEVVREGDVVVDLGTGTGILAMLAGRAGARRVVGIDQAEITQVAADLVDHNGLGDRVQILRGEASALVLDEPADLLISEWLGSFALVEGMLDDLVVCRDLNLGPGGKMLPARVQLMLAAVDDPVLFVREGPGFWRDPIQGLDFAPLERLELQQGRAVQLRLDPAALVSAPACLLDLDMRTVRVKDPYRDSVLELQVKRDGVLNGFAGWFTAQLSPSVSLDTGPEHPETHWAQSYLTFPPQPVRRGETLRVEVSLRREPGERRALRLTLRALGQEQRYLLE